MDIKMKINNIKIGVIIILAFSVIILSVVNINRKDEFVNYKNRINDSFLSTLNLASSNFTTNFEGDLESELFNYNYKDAIANLAMASQLVIFTDYTNINKSLNLTLYNLYKIMEQDKNRQQIESNFNLIYKNLMILCQNPNDISATENLNAVIKTFY